LLLAAARARRHAWSIGIEATGYTLEEIETRDPAWIRRLRDLIQAGKAELIGSGYAQLIGPLVPAKLVAANLKIGNDVYRHLLGVSPRVALVNEQAYSGGLVGHYLDAGYEALLMDWDNRPRITRMAGGDSLSATPRHGGGWPFDRLVCGPTRSRSKNCSVTRMAISHLDDYLDFRCDTAQRTASRALSLCQ